MAMTTAEPESVLTVTVDEKKLALIESIAAECRDLAVSAAKPIVRSMKIAQAIKILRDLLDGMREEIMRLQGSRLGFKADKEYQWNVVRECIIEATVSAGAHWTGNEINIIAGNMYLTKEYFQRAMSELPGLEYLELHPGVPDVRGDTARVPYMARWSFNGHADSLNCLETKGADGVLTDYRLPVIARGGATMDNLLGKAERKMRARIMGRITGAPQNYPDGDADDNPRNGTAPMNLDDLTKKIEGKPEEPKSLRASEEIMLTFESRIREADTQLALNQIGDELKAVTMEADQRMNLRETFAARKKELGK